MKHLNAINYREVPFGFEYGSAKITRLCSDDKKGWVVIRLDTPKHHDLQIYVTKTGKVRISDSRGEWTPQTKENKTMKEEPPSEYLVNWVISLGLGTGHADTTEDLLDDVGAHIKDVFDKYYDLLYQVQNKIPNESRHETALRLLRSSGRSGRDTGSCYRA